MYMDWSSLFSVGEAVHLKRGGKYRVFGSITVQSTEPVKDNEELILYMDPDGKVFGRPYAEMYDGRFHITPSLVPDELTWNPNQDQAGFAVANSVGRLEHAGVLQQLFVPDQLALVWRIDILRALGRMQSLQVRAESLQDRLVELEPKPDSSDVESSVVLNIKEELQYARKRIEKYQGDLEACEHVNSELATKIRNLENNLDWRDSKIKELEYQLKEEQSRVANPADER